MRKTFKLQAASLAVTSVLALSCAAASATNLSTSTSCLRGAVDAYEYAEFEQNFRESTWDTRAGVELLADHAEVTLKVLDLNGVSVCENVADLDTRCSFKLRYGDNFTIIVDNRMRASQTGYRLCAF